MTFAKHCKNLRKLVLLLVGTVVLSNAAFSADDSGEEKESATQNSTTIEQIIVTAPRSLFRLRARIERAEDAFYSDYNNLNVDNEFDVDCQNIVYTGTHISKHECWPEFFSRIVARNSQDALQGIGFLETVSSLANQYGNQFDNLRANIEKIAIENPSVANSLMELELLKQTLKTQREECMERPALLFLLRKCY